MSALFPTDHASNSAAINSSSSSSSGMNGTSNGHNTSKTETEEKGKGKAKAKGKGKDGKEGEGEGEDQSLQRQGQSESSCLKQVEALGAVIGRHRAEEIPLESEVRTAYGSAVLKSKKGKKSKEKTKKDAESNENSDGNSDGNPDVSEKVEVDLGWGRLHTDSSQLEWRKKLYEMSLVERIERALEYKREGAELFKQTHLVEAIQKWELALVYMRQLGRDPNDDELKEVIMPCMNNIVLARLQRGEADLAEERATDALEYPDNAFTAKSYFLRGKAKRARGEHTPALSDLKKAARLAPNSKAIRQEYYDLKKEVENTNIREKKMYSGKLDGITDVSMSASSSTSSSSSSSTSSSSSSNSSSSSSSALSTKTSHGKVDAARKEHSITTPSLLTLSIGLGTIAVLSTVATLFFMRRR